MVEGPTAKAYAVRIENRLKGEVIRRLYAKSRRLHVSPSLAIGKMVTGAESLGKNIVVRLEELAIRLHLMMYGSIHLYELGEPLLKPEAMVRLILEGEGCKLVAYNAPIVELDLYERLMTRLKAGLGPDPLRPDWDFEKALRRLRGFKGKVGVALLDQQVIAGLGNILRNEILFRAEVHPERQVRSLSLDEVCRLIEEAKRLSEEFLARKLRGERIAPLLKVYNRQRQPCPRCGYPIKLYFQEPIKRKTFVCERCQR